MASRDPVLRWASEAKRAEQLHGVPAAVILGLIEIETGGNPAAVSSAGARGVTQFMPGTAPGYGVKFGTSAAAIRTQIEGAAKYLKAMGWDKDRRRALGAYNGGPGNPQYGYADKVLAAAKKYGDLANIKVSGSVSSNAGGGAVEPLGDEQRGQAVKALLWIAFVLGGFALTLLGSARLFGLRPASAMGAAA